ncbi:MAG: hypothetical protein CMP08_05930 [Xanthomonadales bacterium]|nr:hypothetical protein [Xanthomonadales bacterium]
MSAHTIHVSAPGKLFLLGEYAVLEGAPALLTAVDRRAHVHATVIDGPAWRISAPNLGLHDLVLGADGRLPAELAPAVVAHLKVFDAVRAEVQARATAALPPLCLHIDTRDFAADGHKLGLGSSAAVAAALTAALATAAGMTLARAELAAWAIAAHRAAQDGTGSGGDVAVSVYGGVISYVRDTPPTALAWPERLIGRAVVTGQGASTPDLVSCVYAYGERDAPGFTRDIQRLAALADEAAGALDDTPAFLDLAARYFSALKTLDAHAGAGIVSPRHDTLAGLAAAHGGRFKSSGAGGGDVGLLFADRSTLRADLFEMFQAAGADVLDLGFAAPGLIHEPQ